MNPTTITSRPLAMGISARTGCPLGDLSKKVVLSVLEAEREPGAESIAHQRRSDVTNIQFPAMGGFDPNDLEQVGWGVIFAPDTDQATKDALRPLLDHRQQQTGGAPFRVYEGATGFHAGDTAITWLDRQNVSLNVVDPDLGVPFYLLVVGPPDKIPFEFQYLLDLYWGVGRLWFHTAGEFRRYAESVVAYEKAVTVPTARQMAFFATEHDFDCATRLFTRCVVNPLCNGEGEKPVPIGGRQEFGLRGYFGKKATKDSFREILRGKLEGGAPAFLFSGTHGMEFDMGDVRQPDAQGALVCADFSGYGGIDESAWFAGSDVPADARVHGLIHLLFACHGGGCPAFDNFHRLDKTPHQIADKPFFSRLPQMLLSHPQGGALAVIAHIDEAWAYSFQGDLGGSQTQGYRDVIGRVLRGERLGQAMDSFNLRWAALSTELAEMQNKLRRGDDIPLETLSDLWVARDDARNFMVFGDPAVRLRVEAMPGLV